MKFKRRKGIKEWTNERKDERTYRRMNEWKKKCDWAIKWTSEELKKWKNEWIDERDPWQTSERYK